MLFNTYTDFVDHIKTGLFDKNLNFYLLNLIIRKEKWEKIEKIINRYSDDKRNKWNLKIIYTEDPDFFILEFTHIESIKKVQIYVKILQKLLNYILLRAFSFELSDVVTSSIVSFVNFSTGFWMGNLDSEFLIEIENDFRKIDADYEFRYLRFFLKEGKTTHETRNPDGLKEFYDRRVDTIKNKGLFTTLKRFKAVIYKKNQELLRFSIGDDCKLYIESGDFNIFSVLLSKIEQNMIKVLENYNLKIDYEVEELIKDEERFRVFKTKSIDQIRYNSEEFECDDWYDRLLQIFSMQNFENYYFMMIEQGNPYLLTKIIDIHSGETIFCSATQNSFKITPSTQNVSGETIAEFLKLIQTEVGIQV